MGIVRQVLHTIFALPFALAAMAVAARDHRGWPGLASVQPHPLLMVCARTCAMAFNRIVDRKFDALNPRTPTGTFPPARLVFSVIASCVLSAAGLLLRAILSTPLCFFLARCVDCGVFYSLTKRFTDYTILSWNCSGARTRRRLAGGKGHERLRLGKGCTNVLLAGSGHPLAGRVRYYLRFAGL